LAPQAVDKLIGPPAAE